MVLGGVGPSSPGTRPGYCSHALRHPAVLGADRQRLDDDEAAAFAPLAFGESRLIPRWLGWLSVLFFVDQAAETVTVFGESGFIAPGGPMNLYLGGLIGMAWVIGVLYWASHRARTPPGLTPAEMP